MAESAAAPLKLSLPEMGSVEFERNFIRIAVCELRFPALLEFETVTPVQLQKELRKQFPIYERQQGVTIGLEIPSRETKHLFRSKKGEWVVSFKTSAISLETNKYRNFDEFREELTRVLEKCKSLIDSDFFTRVGLRYVNEIPIGEGSLSDWIRPDLVLPLVNGAYGDVSRFYQEVRGTAQTGSYSFRHGYSDLEKAAKRLYTIDFDFYLENVPFDETLTLVTQFNRESFRFFSWVIGPKTRERLGREIIKKEAGG